MRGLTAKQTRIRINSNQDLPSLPIGSETPVRAFVALGSNLGDRGPTMDRAIAALARTPAVRLVRFSNYLENPAVGGPSDAPCFLNAAAEIETMLSARALLERLLEIEMDLGRVRSEKWSPRTIDLDLLLYGEQIIREPGLTVPHPLIHERRFVLEPLVQIAPTVRHPALGKAMRELLDLLNAIR